MARPRKNTVLCRKLAKAAAAAATQRRMAQSSTADNVVDEILSEPEDERFDSGSDQDIFIIGDVIEEVNIDNIEPWLAWKEGAGASLRPVYHGDSRTTQWRKKTEKRKRHESVANVPKITSFFRSRNDFETNLTLDEIPKQHEAMHTVQEAIQLLDEKIRITPNVIVERQTQNITKWNHGRYLAVRRYLQCLLDREPKVQSSEQISSVLFPSRGKVHTGTLIRGWSHHFMQTGELPSHAQGKFVKRKSLIHDEDVQQMIRSFLRTEPQVSLTSNRLASRINEELGKRIGLESPLTISSRTAQRWLNILGLRFGKYAKGLYNDGHEREDVVQYRELFLERMSLYEWRMAVYDGDFMEITREPELRDGEKRLVLVTHDESCFGSNDGRNYCWLDDDNRQIRPKGNGRSIMVSAFLCECHGLLKLPESLQIQHPNVPAESTVMMKPGAGSEGYWKNADLVRQVKERAIPIFKILHPMCDGLFVFDNSQNHHALAPDALSVGKMNRSDGGANQRLMRDGWFLDQGGNRIVQKMVLVDGKTAKGLERVLSERGLWNPSFDLKQARKLLSEQPDFREQQEWLAETVIEGGCQIDFYPKYHCEFNFIEMFWGAAKAWSRARCTFNFNDLVNLVPLALDSVPLSKIRKFARKTYRYMDAYRLKDFGGNSLNSCQIEYAVKKYRGHRKIPTRILENI